MTPPKKDTRDWDKELAKVDQVMAREGTVPAPGLRPVAPAPVTSPAVSPRAGVFTWMRLSLALVLGVGMTQWPYVHGCGLPLYAYLGGATAVMVASVWSMLSSWRSRSAVAHVVGIVLFLWGGALAAREILPRVGYARQTARWSCAQPGEPNPAPVPATPAPAPAPAP